MASAIIKYQLTVLKQTLDSSEEVGSWWHWLNFLLDPCVNKTITCHMLYSKSKCMDEIGA